MERDAATALVEGYLKGKEVPARRYAFNEKRTREVLAVFKESQEPLAAIKDVLVSLGVVVPEEAGLWNAAWVLAGTGVARENWTASVEPPEGLLPPIPQCVTQAVVVHDEGVMHSLQSFVAGKAHLGSSDVLARLVAKADVGTVTAEQAQEMLAELQKEQQKEIASLDLLQTHSAQLIGAAVQQNRVN